MNKFGETLKSKLSLSSKTLIQDPEKTLPFGIKDIKNGLNDWKNIPEMVRMAFLAIFDNMKNQTQEIKNLKSENENLTLNQKKIEEELKTRAEIETVTRSIDMIAEKIDEDLVSREDLKTIVSNFATIETIEEVLNRKVDIVDFKEISGDKIGREEFEFELQEIKKNLDDNAGEVKEFSKKFATKYDFERVKMSVKDFVDYSLFKSELEAKADKSAVYGALENKVGFDILEEEISKKTDVLDFEKILGILEKKADESSIEEIAQILVNKVNKEDFEQLCDEINEKSENERFENLETELGSLKQLTEQFITELDETLGDFKSLSENLKEEIERNTEEISSKADTIQIDQIRAEIRLKLDRTLFLHELSQIKAENLKKNDKISQGFKKQNLENINLIEELQADFLMRNKELERDFQALKERIDLVSEGNENMKNEVVNFAKSVNESLKQDTEIQYEDLLQRFQGTCNELNNVEDLSKKNREILNGIEEKMEEFFKVVKDKVDIDEVQCSLNACQADFSGRFSDLRTEILNVLKTQEDSYSELLNNKIDFSVAKKLIGEKSNLNDVERLVDTYVNSYGIHGILERMDQLESDLERACIQNSSETLNQILKEDLEDVKKVLMLKANLKDICTILDKKAEINDINSILSQLQEKLNTKSDLINFSHFKNEQSLINEFLCSENVIGRWKWTSGKLLNKNHIPWEHQSINTLSDNFLWEKNSSKLLVMSGGMYKICFGLYSFKKPNAKLMINGQAVISAVNSTAYAVHHSSGRLKDLKISKNQSSNGTTGLTFVDFVFLPPKAVLSLAFHGEKRGHGFFEIKKIQ